MNRHPTKRETCVPIHSCIHADSDIRVGSVVGACTWSSAGRDGRRRGSIARSLAARVGAHLCVAFAGHLLPQALVGSATSAAAAATLARVFCHLRGILVHQLDALGAWCWFTLGGGGSGWFAATGGFCGRLATQHSLIQNDLNLLTGLWCLGHTG